MKQFSPGFEILVGYLCRLLLISSSVLNPVLYTVRKRQFRVACIELPLRKSSQDAEEFDRRLFASRGNATRPQNGQEGEEREQNTEERNAAHANSNLEDNPEVCASGANCDENSFPLQNETLNPNELTRPSESAREQHDGEGDVAHHKNKQEDNPEVFASGAKCDENSFPMPSEPFSSNEPNLPPKSTRKKHDEEDLPHDKNKQGDNPEVLASGASGEENILPPQRELFRPNAATRPSKSTREEHDQERNAAHDKNKHEETPERLTSGANPDENTLSLPDEPFTSNALTDPSKSRRDEHSEEENPTNDKTKQEHNTEVNVPGFSVGWKRTDTGQTEN